MMWPFKKSREQYLALAAYHQTKAQSLDAMTGSGNEVPVALVLQIATDHGLAAKYRSLAGAQESPHPASPGPDGGREG